MSQKSIEQFKPLVEAATIYQLKRILYGPSSVYALEGEMFPVTICFNYLCFHQTYIHLLIFSSDTALLLRVLPVLDLQFL